MIGTLLIHLVVQLASVFKWSSCILPELQLVSWHSEQFQVVRIASVQLFYYFKTYMTQGLASLQAVIVFMIGFFLYGPQMLIGIDDTLKCDFFPHLFLQDYVVLRSLGVAPLEPVKGF